MVSRGVCRLTRGITRWSELGIGYFEAVLP